jgi:glyoxylate carboligase
MATTVADVMVATLRASGVQRVYGIPGDSLNGFTDAMRRGRHHHLGARPARAEGKRGWRFSVRAAAPSRTSGPMKLSIS